MSVADPWVRDPAPRPPTLDPFIATPFDVGGWIGDTLSLGNVHWFARTREDHHMNPYTQFEKGLNAVLQMIDANVPANWTLFEIVIDAISQFPTLAEHAIASPKVRSFERFEQLRTHMQQAQAAVEEQNLGSFRIVVVGILNEFTAAPAAA